MATDSVFVQISYYITLQVPYGNLNRFISTFGYTTSIPLRYEYASFDFRRNVEIARLQVGHTTYSQYHQEFLVRDLGIRGYLSIRSVINIYQVNFKLFGKNEENNFLSLSSNSIFQTGARNVHILLVIFIRAQ